jgi:hypothetical protein
LTWMRVRQVVEIPHRVKVVLTEVILA